MITVKAFVDCSYCQETFSSEMDTAADDVFEEGINSLLMCYDHLQTIDEDKGICICSSCFEKWIKSENVKYDLENGSIDEWAKLINQMKDSPWNPS